MVGKRSELVSFLMAHRAATSADVVDAGIELVDEMRERFVLTTCLFGERPAYMIKRPRHAAALKSLRQEVRAYRYLVSCSAIDSIVPALVADDMGRGILVSEWVGDAVPVNACLPPLEAAHRLGAEIGKLHAATRGAYSVMGAAERPWVLASCKEPLRRMPERRAVLARTHCADAIEKGLRWGYRAWNPSALIHGDLKWEHCLLGSGHWGEHICLIDWELAAFGDPAWDVGSILSDILFHAEYDAASEARPVKAVERSEAVRSLLDSYSRSGPPVDAGFVDRVALYTGSRLFQTSLEAASAFGFGEEAGTDLLLAMAVDIFLDPGGFSRQLKRGYVQ